MDFEKRAKQLIAQADKDISAIKETLKDLERECESLPRSQLSAVLNAAVERNKDEIKLKEKTESGISLEVAEESLIHLVNVRPIAMQLYLISKECYEHLEIRSKQIEAQILVSGYADDLIKSKGLNVTDNMRGAFLRGHSVMCDLRERVSSLKVLSELAEKMSWALVNDEQAYTEITKGKYKLKGVI